jgi:RNA polymerase sigma factor (sigma-70 family)
MPAPQAPDQRIRPAPRQDRRMSPDDEPELSTEDLVAAARRREPEAWAELVARYGGMVRGVVASFRLQEADAADAVQMTWLRAFERLDSVRSPDRLGGWLATIANRECLALLRRSRWETPDETVAGDVQAAGPSPEASVLVAEARGAVQAAVAALPRRRQQLVHALFYRSERDYLSLADELGMPVGSIGPTRGRVLRALRGSLEPAGFGATPVAGFEEDPPVHATAC